jgi:hypothetical protein
MILPPVFMDKNIRSNQFARFSVRKTLADSHVAAVTIASLFLVSLSCIASAIGDPLIRVGYFIVEAIAILDIPSYSRGFTYENFMLVMASLNYLYFGVFCGFAAGFLSLWVYAVGPFTSLRRYRKLIVGSRRA